MTKEFASEQPKHGDRMIHCGHMDAHMDGHHFFKLVPPMKFKRPDGTTDDAQWIIACDVCYHLAEGNAKKIQIKGDGTWKGDEPAVYKNDK